MFKVELRFQNIVLKGFNIEDGDTLTIGRDEANDVTITDSSISRLHACIVRSGDELTVWDKGSKTGIVVNERKVESAQLKDGDIVRLGANHNLKVYMTANNREPTMTSAQAPS